MKARITLASGSQSAFSFNSVFPTGKRRLLISLIIWEYQLKLTHEEAASKDSLSNASNGTAKKDGDILISSVEHFF